jgi:hypothetical protein
MSDINFDCPFCKQNLDAPEDMAGMNIECPACGRIIRVPRPVHVESPIVHRTAVPPRQPPPVGPSGQGRRTETGPIPETPTEDQGSTTRIEMPPEYAKPAPKHRVIFIKRAG